MSNATVNAYPCLFLHITAYARQAQIGKDEACFF